MCAIKTIEHERYEVIPDIKTNALSTLHYVFIVPTYWDNEVRETLLRPIFIQARLITNDDHNMDRLQFFTRLETALEYMRQPEPITIQKSKELEKDRPYLMLDFFKSSCSFTIFETKYPSTMADIITTKVIHSEDFSDMIDAYDAKKNVESFVKDMILDDDSDLDDNVLLEILKYYIKIMEVLNESNNNFFNMQ